MIGVIQMASTPSQVRWSSRSAMPARSPTPSPLESRTTAGRSGRSRPFSTRIRSRSPPQDAQRYRRATGRLRIFVMTAGVTPRRRAPSDRRQTQVQEFLDREGPLVGQPARSPTGGIPSPPLSRGHGPRDPPRDTEVVSDLPHGSPCGVTALPPGGRIGLLGQRSGIAKRPGHEVLITGVRHRTDLRRWSPAPLPGQRGPAARCRGTSRMSTALRGRRPCRNGRREAAAPAPAAQPCGSTDNR